MKAKCLLGHEWQGCKCLRCGKERDLDHQWNDGCQCAVCGLVRDAQHDWGLLDCRQQCRVCKRMGEEVHDWQQCVCRLCGQTRHDWDSGVCRTCGKHCLHEHVCEEFQLLDEIDSETVHLMQKNVCQDCHMDIKEIWSKP